MASPSLDADAFGQLNHEQKALLDTVDSLRSQGVDEIVHLPQIIVVGDQSSGKSSVLEAISRVRFPITGGICTRFATELVVRTSPHEEAVVKIHAHNSTTAEKNVVFNERQFSSGDLPKLIERAKDAMGISNDANGFSEDVLHIEVSGPDLPSLTLVDLPGIYHNETADQSRAGMKVVRRLVEKYMKQKKSIILAVVNASYDFSNQGILTDVKRHDPDRQRTMGIVTNPDRLTPRSIEEGKYVRLVRNQEPLHTLKYGWHVLRNRGPDANDEQGQGAARTSDKERDEAEKRFLSSNIWGPLPDSIKGIDTLRRKLSRVLTKHIQLSLPSVIEEIEKKLEERRETLARLGRPRTAPAELRNYLHDIAESFRNLTRLAVRGAYDDLAFFGVPYADDYPRGPHVRSDARRLRAVVRNLNHAFDKVISTYGMRREILWEDDEDEDDDDDEDEDSGHGGSEKSDSEDKHARILTDYMNLYEVEEPEEVSWTELEKELEVQASVNLNTNFPGSANDRLALNHFRDQSQRWRSIAAMHLDLVVKSVKTFVELALGHITAGDEATRDALLREWVDPFFEQRASRLAEKLDELLRHYEHGEALMLETEFVRALSAKQKLRLARHVKGILDAEQLASIADKSSTKLSRSTIARAVSEALESRTSQFGLETVVDIATVYYEMSLRTFTENVIVLAVENCLVSELPSMLTSSMVHEMDEDTLAMLAAESPGIKQERMDVERDIRVLTEGLLICKRHRPRESTAHLSHLPSRPISTGTSGRPSSSTPPPEIVLEAPQDASSQTPQPTAAANESTPEKHSPPPANKRHRIKVKLPPAKTSQEFFDSLRAQPVSSAATPSASQSSSVTSGGTSTPTTTGGGLFGSQPISSPAAASTSTTGGGLFGNPPKTSPAAAVPTSTPGSGLFGSQPTSGPAAGSSPGTYGGVLKDLPKTSPVTTFTPSAGGKLFGGQPKASLATTDVGSTAPSTPGSGLFTNPPKTSPAAAGSGSTTASTAGGGLSGSTLAARLVAASTPTAGGGLFGSKPATNPAAASTPTAGGGLFGGQPASSPAAASTPTTGGGLFGGQPKTSPAPAGFGTFGGFGTSSPGGGSFGSQPKTSPTPAGFGGSSTSATSGGLFGGQPKTSPAPAGFGTFGGFRTPSPGGASFGDPPKSSPAPAGFGTFGGFGSTSTPTTGGALFGRTPSTSPAPTGFGSSGFGGALKSPPTTDSFSFASKLSGPPSTPSLGTPSTKGIQFTGYEERETLNPRNTTKFLHISFDDAFKNYSPEELRLRDYGW